MVKPKGRCVKQLILNELKQFLKTCINKPNSICINVIRKKKIHDNMDSDAKEKVC